VSYTIQVESANTGGTVLVSSTEDTKYLLRGNINVHLSLTCDMDEDVTLTGETNGGLIQFAESDNIQTQECDNSCHP